MNVAGLTRYLEFLRLYWRIMLLIGLLPIGGLIEDIFTAALFESLVIGGIIRSVGALRDNGALILLAGFFAGLFISPAVEDPVLYAITSGLTLLPILVMVGLILWCMFCGLFERITGVTVDEKWRCQDLGPADGIGG